MREVDLAARIGGEEFVVVMPDSSDEVGIKVAERLRATVAAVPVTVPGAPQPIPVTVSVGVAVVTPGETGSEAMRRADEALYVAKSTGRNKVSQARGAPSPGRARPAVAG